METTERQRRHSVAEGRVLDLDALKGLAHPLRVLIVDTLSTYGPFTASGLADRLGESSGSTSYHLRQLERHGFVREVEGRGTARERWWERVPGPISLDTVAMTQSPGSRAASELVLQQWQENSDRLISDFHRYATDLLPPEWVDTSEFTKVNLRLTREQLEEIVSAWEELLANHIEKYRGQNPTGSRPVQVQFNAFPVADGEPTP